METISSLFFTVLNTKMGQIVALASEKSLYLLQFLDPNQPVTNLLESFEKKFALPLEEGRTKPIDSIAKELDLYFEGTLKNFLTPCLFLGTPFQQRVWQALKSIPYGKTISYSELAKAVDNPKGCRAVAQANASNLLVIIVPCHRVIAKGGALGGYNCGLARKQYLLDLERLQTSKSTSS